MCFCNKEPLFAEATAKEAEKEVLPIEAAKKPSAPEQSKPAPVQPNPKKLKRERPSSRFGLPKESDSEASDEEAGKTLPILAPKQAAAAKKADSLDTSLQKDKVTFGGNRSPEEGSRLQDFLKDAQPSLQKPVFSFAPPAKTSVNGQKGKTGQDRAEKLPNGLPDGLSTLSEKKPTTATFAQPQTSSKDKSESYSPKVRLQVQQFDVHRKLCIASEESCRSIWIWAKQLCF